MKPRKEKKRKKRKKQKKRRMKGEESHALYSKIRDKLSEKVD